MRTRYCRGTRAATDPETSQILRPPRRRATVSPVAACPQVSFPSFWFSADDFIPRMHLEEIQLNSEVDSFQFEVFLSWPRVMIHREAAWLWPLQWHVGLIGRWNRTSDRYSFHTKSSTEQRAQRWFFSTDYASKSPLWHQQWGRRYRTAEVINSFVNLKKRTRLEKEIIRCELFFIRTWHDGCMSFSQPGCWDAGMTWTWKTPTRKPPSLSLSFRFLSSRCCRL